MLIKSCLQVREMEKPGQIDFLTMSKLEEIITTVAIVCHHYERLAVLRMFS